MKTTHETVYRCEHCNRGMFRAGAMSRHEKWCDKNPKNQHKCFDYCKHLEIKVNYEHDEYGSCIGRNTHMLCTKQNLFMYSYKLEKLYLPKEEFEGLERMPLRCGLHEYMSNYDNP